MILGLTIVDIIALLHFSLLRFLAAVIISAGTQVLIIVISLFLYWDGFHKNINFNALQMYIM